MKRFGGGKKNSDWLFGQWFRCIAPAALACFLFLSGCAVGPNYKRPEVLKPQHFRDDDSVTNKSFAELNWWQVYQDPTLQDLVRQALTNNFDLRIAITRVEQARWLAVQTRSQFGPNVSYSGSIDRGRNNVLGQLFPTGGSTATTVGASLNAAWEIDLWGRVRRLNESSTALYAASENDRRGVKILVMSEVAADYLRLLELDQELEIARSTTNSFAQSLEIFSKLASAGSASDLESSRAEAAKEDADSQMHFIMTQRTETENELNILLGHPPGPIERGAVIITNEPPIVPAGLPSSLLERRPDILAAQEQFRSANALEGVSVAEFFPQIGLTAFLGKASPALSAFTAGTANAWGIGANAAGPLFDSGKAYGRFKQAKAYREEERLKYQETVLDAFREVSDILVDQKNLKDSRTVQAAEVKALKYAVQLSTERYQEGMSGYYEVLEAQQQLFPAQLNLARTQRDQFLALISLYKALGGGWGDEMVKAKN